MAVDIGPRIGIDGEKEFRQQLRQINQSIKTLGSEMKLVTSEFEGQERSQESLTRQNQTLGKTVDTLKQKLAMQERALEESANAYGEADVKTQKWQQAVNETRTALNRAESAIEANERAIDELGDETQQTSRQVDELGDEAQQTGNQFERSGSDLKDFGSKAKTAIGVATKAVAALGAATLAAVAGLARMTVEAAYNADEINTLSKQTGLSTEEVQKFMYASEQIDVPIETLAGSMSRLTRNMGTAAGGTGAAAEAFDALGVQITDSNGQLRDNQEVFNDVIDALAKMENETQRDAYAMSIFGKSAQELNPLIEGGAEALEEYGRQAEEAGLILSQETLDSLNEVADALDTLKATATGAGNALTVTFAPIVAEGLELITEYLTRLTSAYKSGGLSSVAQELAAIVNEILAALTSALPQIVAFGTDVAFSLIEGVLQQLPAIAEAGLVIIQELFKSDSLKSIIPFAVDAVVALANTITENADLTVDAAIALVEALTAGITEAAPILAESAPYIVWEWIKAIVRNAPKVWEAAFAMIKELAAGVVNAYSIVWDSAKGVIEQFVAKIRELLSRAASVGRDMAARVAEGIRSAVSSVISAAGRVVTSFVNAVKDRAASLYNVGVEIVRGVWEGIASRVDWFTSQVRSFFSNIIASVKSALGIASPSKVFAEIGSYMAQGIGVGFSGQMDSVAREMQSSIPVPDMTTANAIAGAVNGIGTLMSAGNQTIELVFNINGKTLARETLSDFLSVANQRGVITA